MPLTSTKAPMSSIMSHLFPVYLLQWKIRVIFVALWMLGNVSVTRHLLNSFVKDGMIGWSISFRSWSLMPSGSITLFMSSHCSIWITSYSFIIISFSLVTSGSWGVVRLSLVAMALVTVNCSLLSIGVGMLLSIFVPHIWL